MSVRSLSSVASAVSTTPGVESSSDAPQVKGPVTPTASGAPAVKGAPVAAKGRGAVSVAVAEATESPAQTLKEAAAGDRQAQKLLHSHLGSHVNTKA